MIKKSCALMVGMVLLFFGIPSAFSEERVIHSNDQLQYAHKLMEEEAYGRAVTELERFIHFFPDDSEVPLARYLIGVCYLKEADYERAIDHFSHIFRSDPDGPFAGKALLMTGESYYEQGAPAEAGHYFMEVLKQYSSPKLRNAAQYRLGWARMMENRWKDASQAFEQVEQGSPLYESAQGLSNASLRGELLPQKEPACAGVMAGVLPGLGHAYVSRYKDALVAFLLNGLFIWATVESFHQDHYVLGGILGFLEVGWYTGNIYSAVNVTHKWNRKVKTDFKKGLKDRFELKLLAADKGPAGLMLSFTF
ncbi:MAG: tetratricopeptide repeat protein [Desulfatiglandaceae bacterium]